MRGSILIPLIVVACSRSSSPSAQGDPPSAPAQPSVAQHAVDAAAAKATALREELCRDGKLIPMPSTATPSGTPPTDDSGPFYVDGVVERASYNYLPLTHCVGGLPLFNANVNVCPAMPGVRACIEAERKTNPSLVGTLDTEISFSKGGGVERVYVKGGSLPEGVHPCITAALKKAVLPADGDAIGSTVDYRINVQAAHGRSPVVKITDSDWKFSGGVDPATIKQHLAVSLERLRRCYEYELRTTPTAGGSVTAELTVLLPDMSSRGVRAKVTAGTMKSKHFLDCAENALSGALFFDTSDAGVTTANVKLEMSYARP